jgi:hypothetical protein
MFLKSLKFYFPTIFIIDIYLLKRSSSALLGEITRIERARESLKEREREREIDVDRDSQYFSIVATTVESRKCGTATRRHCSTFTRENSGS